MRGSPAQSVTSSDSGEGQTLSASLPPSTNATPARSGTPLGMSLPPPGTLSGPNVLAVIAADPSGKCAEVKRLVETYFKMVRWRMTEMVPKAIVHHMAKDFTGYMHQELSQKLSSRTDADLFRLFPETELIIHEVETLTTQLKNCEDALRDLDHIEHECALYSLPLSHTLGLLAL